MADMIAKVIGITFAVYVIAYAAVDAISSLVNRSTSFATGSPIAAVLTTLVPIIIALGLGWMIFKHASIGGK